MLHPFMSTRKLANQAEELSRQWYLGGGKGNNNKAADALFEKIDRIRVQRAIIYALIAIALLIFVILKIVD